MNYPLTEAEYAIWRETLLEGCAALNTLDTFLRSLCDEADDDISVAVTLAHWFQPELQ